MLADRYRIAIYARAREHGVDRESLHETIWINWQKRSINDLTDDQARSLLDGLRGNKPQTRRRNSPARAAAMQRAGRRVGAVDGTAYLPSDQEVALLRGLAAKMKWTADGLDRFTARVNGGPITDLASFNRVLNGVRAIARRRGIQC